MIRFLQLYGLLSVFLRGAALSFQSLTIGGIGFVCFVVQPLARGSELDVPVVQPILRWIRRWSLALVAVETAYLTVNIFILTRAGGVAPFEALGADFVKAGLLAITSAMAIALWTSGRPRGHRYMLLPAVLIILANVMTSHAMARIHERLQPAVLTALHQAATAAWIGGLPYLLIALKGVPDDLTRQLCERFSKLAIISVALLATAGLLLAFVYVGSWQSFYGTSYGTMVGSKIVLFGLLLILGLLNFRLVHGAGAASYRQSFTTRLRHFGEVEIGVGFSVILAAASLTSLPPAADVLAGRVSRNEIIARIAPRRPRLESPKSEELLRQISEAPSYPALSTTSTDPSNTPSQTDLRPAAGIAWSEYNHHWAGLIVLMMGLLAALATSNRMRWARYWPLLFLGLACFIVLRADPENWPLGPGSFWGSWGNPEVLLHRVFAGLIVAFAIGETKAQTSYMGFQTVGLVFPIVSALGGVLLLTHSHNLGNIKEEMLAELSHNVLAVLGIIAGWSRWLELKLPPEERVRKASALLWPVCFVLIGLVLLNYRES